MDNKSSIKLYFMWICGFVALFSILLPWISYGVGSKTGLDIGRKTAVIVFVCAVSFLICSYISYKIKDVEKLFLYLTLTISTFMFLTYLFEIIRISYQSTMARSLPVEMYGVASIAAANIQVGYGLWLGGLAALLPTIVNLAALKLYK